MMRVADWIIQRLAEEGIKHIFLLPGGGAMHLNDAVACDPRITPVPCHHEQACGIAAEAYGRTAYPDNPGFGVALVTTGPGATNVITPVTGAWIDSIPMLVLSGQVKRSDRLAGRPLRQGGVQEVDVIPMVSGITKYATTLDDPQEVRLKLETALLKMRTGRPGPVWIEVPLDVQGALIDIDKLPGAIVEPEIIPQSHAEQLCRVLNLLASAKRPLILAGHGVRLSGGADAFLQLVHTWQVPVVCTWNALDLIPHDDPLYVGSPGVVALRAPNFAVQNCDLLIVFGCRLDNVITAYNPRNFAPHATKVVVDIDQAELHKSEMQIDVKIHADVARVINSLISLENPPVRPITGWLQRCRDWKARYTVNDGKPFETSDAISHYQFVDVLSDVLPEDILIATGSSGLAVEVFYSAFRSKSGQRIFLTSGLGSMGYGLAASVGACLGNNSQQAIALESDGSLMLNLQEMATLKNLNLPIRLIIMDNHGYASIRNTQRNYFEGRYIATDSQSGLWIPDLHTIAEAMGLPCYSITSSRQLKAGLQKILDAPAPLVCIVNLSSNESLSPKVSAIPQPDGTILSMPLEDMTPLLGQDVLAAEMYYPLSEASLQARSI
jgi:acetolactate synthase-1/2/3 large subunit